MIKSSVMNEAQKDVWTAIQLDPTLSLNYNLAIGIHLDGKLDVETLKTAVTYLIERHEALRTVPNLDGTTQRIFDQIELPFEYFDYRGFSAEEQQAELKTHRLAEVSNYFDLENGPLCRFKCLSLSDTQHLVLISCHHIISDGWSMSVLASNLGAFYTAVCQNSPPELGELMQLSDFNEQLETAVGSPDYQEAEAYWLDQFADSVPVLDLPTDRRRSARKTAKGLQIDVPINNALMTKIKKVSRDQRTTPYSYLLASFQGLLHRFSGQKQIVVGIPVAGQLSTDSEDLVGHCVNFLPIRIDFNKEMTFSNLLDETKNQIFDGIAHQGYPSGQLIKNLPIKRDNSRLPLISVAFNQFPTRLIEPFDRIEATFEVLPRHFELFDIFMNVIEEPSGYKIQCTASQDLFEQATIERMIRSYLNFLASSVEMMGKRVTQIPLLSKSQKEKMVNQWNQTEMAYNPTATIHTMFSTRAEQFSDKTAVMSPYGTLTYAELERRSNKLANHLQKMGVQSNQFVGICLNRTPNLIVGLLGILKAGGAYLPMDPNYPEERLKFMLEDSQATILLAETETINELPQFLGRTILIDKDWGEIEEANTPPVQFRHNNMSQVLAYTIFTSGSTGKPKGVKITHRNVVNFLHAMQKEPGIRSTDVLMAVTTLSFDIAVLELFLPLVSGATIALADIEMSRDGQRLADGLSSMNVTMMQATPATWQMLLAVGWQPPAGFKMLSGGEPLPQNLARSLISDDNQLWNMYGPTETTIWSSVSRVTSPDLIDIGKPVGNTQMYILDKHLNPVPIGVTGELWIAGDGVSKGYLNRPTLTSERFIQNPFVKSLGAKMYHTGDLAKYLPDGTIVCLGRVDFQVKVRGFRIELGEIEATLGKHESVREAVVTAVDLGNDDKRLVAYILLEQGVNALETSVLRRYLQSKLPAYMVPSNFVIQDQFPLMPNGKLDRLTLQNPLDAIIDNTDYVPPKSQTEQKIAEIWSQHLKVEKVSIHSDFFELGGHSLLATQIISKIRDNYAIDLTLADFFDAPNIADLAKQIEAVNWNVKLKTAPLQSIEGEAEEFEF